MTILQMVIITLKVTLQTLESKDNHYKQQVAGE